ncbi:hypothetical protein AVEN_162227-1 [Araneus ventricosus]|uniref:Uncharacterized protein n=1 Tax=Araneus ventricosus TaxID=182803 RepID=A0A4Y2EXU1_ARAVE|nr:hypothetical protein AVEN_162227-1 [Araneus ventricosus]
MESLRDVVLVKLRERLVSRRVLLSCRRWWSGADWPIVERQDSRRGLAPLSVWQDNWDNGETGRSTHDIVPRVSNKPVGWNREEIMFVTGHGPVPSYLLRCIMAMIIGRGEK